MPVHSNVPKSHFFCDAWRLSLREWFETYLTENPFQQSLELLKIHKQITVLLIFFFNIILS